MAPGQQLLSAQVQLAEVGLRSRGYHWDIHCRDYSVLKEALGVGGFFLAIPFNVTEDEELLGAGPVLVRERSG